MAGEYYIIPENPAYKADEIRKLQDTDPASASLIFNPVFEKIIESLAYEKNTMDSMSNSMDEFEQTSGSFILMPKSVPPSQRKPKTLYGLILQNYGGES